MAEHNTFGMLGEQKAVAHLEGKGYKICHRNYRYLSAEIDIVAQKDDVLAIVEVKSRNTGFLEDISTVITTKKIKLLTMAANQYIEKNDLDVEVRFDVITVVKSGQKFEIEHIEDAFYHF